MDVMDIVFRLLLTFGGVSVIIVTIGLIILVWTQKALIEGVIQYAAMQSSIYWEESSAIGCQGDVVYLIKPLINDYWRWIVFKFGEDEYGEAIMVIIISAHKDEKIYGKNTDLITERGEQNGE